jgi:hypothetical protein
MPDLSDRDKIFRAAQQYYSTLQGTYKEQTTAAGKQNRQQKNMMASHRQRRRAVSEMLMHTAGVMLPWLINRNVPSEKSRFSNFGRSMVKNIRLDWKTSFERTICHRSTQTRVSSIKLNSRNIDVSTVMRVPLRFSGRCGDQYRFAIIRYSCDFGS